MAQIAIYWATVLAGFLIGHAVTMAYYRGKISNMQQTIDILDLLLSRNLPKTTVNKNVKQNYLNN